MKKIKNYQEFTNEEINWKRGLATAALATGVGFSNPVFSQISRVTPSKKDNKIEIPEFDSTTVNSPVLTNMIGQKFLIIQSSDYYKGCKFYTSKYKLMRSRYYNQTHIKDAFGREIKLLEVLVDDSLDFDYLDKGVDFIHYILKFEDINTKEILYFDYRTSFDKLSWNKSMFGGEDRKIVRSDDALTLEFPSSLPFISTGFIEKLSNQLKGTEYNKFIDTLLNNLDKFEWQKLITLKSHSPSDDSWIDYSDETILRRSLGFSDSYINNIEKNKTIGVRGEDKYQDYTFQDVVLNETTKKLSFRFISSDGKEILRDTPDNFFDKFKIKK